MSAKRIFAIARRVMRQIRRDRRTVALMIVAPMLMLTLGAILFRADPAIIPLGIVNEDEGFAAPMSGRIEIGDRIAEELAALGTFELKDVGRDEIDARLRDGTVDAVLVMPADFSAQFARDHQVTLDLRLEGSNPTQSAGIAGRTVQAAMKALVGVGTALVGLGGGDAQLPVALNATYLYAGPEFDTMDYVAPVYIGVLVMFFVFLLTCVSFLRERSQGTMERLMATPASRSEIVLGYMAGLGLFALIQSTIILTFTIWVLKIHYLGSLALLFLVVILLALTGVSLGILASAFARNEFQVVQFIPLVIIPQALLGGTFWAAEDMPAYLQPLAYAMPLTYANRALRDVMLKGWGLGDIWPNLLILTAFVAALTILGARTMRREVA